MHKYVLYNNVNISSIHYAYWFKVR